MRDDGDIKGQVVDYRPGIFREGIIQTRPKACLLLVSLIVGWIWQQIAERLGVDFTTISKDLKYSHFGNIQDDLGPLWNEKGIADATGLSNRRTKDKKCGG